jgi:glucosylceramidase
MTDSSAFVLQGLKEHNPRLYEFTMRRLFSPDQGAGFSYLRRPIGSSDYTATESYYTYADRPAGVAPDQNDHHQAWRAGA